MKTSYLPLLPTGAVEQRGHMEPNGPRGAQGTPFTIFYKPCLGLLAAQAQMDSFYGVPGWFEEFSLSEELLWKLPYHLRRPQIPKLNQPESWTMILHKGKQ